MTGSSQYAGVWTLAYVPNAPNNNTYEVEATSRVGSCNPYLSGQGCPGGVIDLYYEVRLALLVLPLSKKIFRFLI
jgi:hypothetical protein